MVLPTDPICLAQWRRATSRIYAVIRHKSKYEPFLAWQAFRQARNNLFKFHTQSPLDAGQREVFRHLIYYDYDPVLRLYRLIDTDVTRQTYQLDLPGDGDFAFTV